jgi:hypothetical protein
MDRCLNCNNELTGDFCSSCGQRRHEHKDRKVTAFIKNFFEESFSFDSKFLKSLKLLLISPGFLTHEYIVGKIASYITPLKMYLFISVVSFFIGSLVNPDDLNSLEEDFDAKPFVESYISQSGVSREVFEAKFNNEFQGKTPLYFLALVVLFSLPLKLIYMQTKRLYVEHLVFSLHFFTFLLIMLTISTLLEFLLPDITYLFLFIIPFVYMFFAVKNVYGQKIIISFFETVILFLYFIGLLFLWLIAAFVITLLTV